jgi:hypothetical protein
VEGGRGGGGAGGRPWCRGGGWVEEGVAGHHLGAAGAPALRASLALTRRPAAGSLAPIQDPKVPIAWLKELFAKYVPDCTREMQQEYSHITPLGASRVWEPRRAWERAGAAR